MAHLVRIRRCLQSISCFSFYVHFNCLRMLLAAIPRILIPLMIGRQESMCQPCVSWPIKYKKAINSANVAVNRFIKWCWSPSNCASHSRKDNKTPVALCALSFISISGHNQRRSFGQKLLFLPLSFFSQRDKGIAPHLIVWSPTGPHVSLRPRLTPTQPSPNPHPHPHPLPIPLPLPSTSRSPSPASLMSVYPVVLLLFSPFTSHRKLNRNLRFIICNMKLKSLHGLRARNAPST